MRKFQKCSGIIKIVCQNRDAQKIAYLEYGKRTEKRFFCKRFRAKNQNFRLVGAPQAPAGCSGRPKRTVLKRARTPYTAKHSK